MMVSKLSRLLVAVFFLVFLKFTSEAALVDDHVAHLHPVVQQLDEQLHDDMQYHWRKYSRKLISLLQERSKVIDAQWTARHLQFQALNSGVNAGNSTTNPPPMPIYLTRLVFVRQGGLASCDGSSELCPLPSIQMAMDAIAAVPAAFAAAVTRPYGIDVGPGIFRGNWVAAENVHTFGRGFDTMIDGNITIVASFGSNPTLPYVGFVGLHFGGPIASGTRYQLCDFTVVSNGVGGPRHVFLDLVNLEGHAIFYAPNNNVQYFLKDTPSHHFTIFIGGGGELLGTNSLVFAGYKFANCPLCLVVTYDLFSLPFRTPPVGATNDLRITGGSTPQSALIINMFGVKMVTGSVYADGFVTITADSSSLPINAKRFFGANVTLIDANNPNTDTSTTVYVSSAMRSNRDAVIFLLPLVVALVVCFDRVRRDL